MDTLLTKEEQERAERVAQSMGGGSKALALAKQELVETRIVRALVSARLNAHISGAEVAKRMGVSPSKISRMENAYDRELSWGDIHDYANAVGLNISMMFDPSGDIATRIKHCVLEVGQQLRHLSHLAKEAKADTVLLEGINRFHKETLFNFILQFDSSYRQIPRIQTDDGAKHEGRDAGRAKRASAAHSTPAH